MLFSRIVCDATSIQGATDSVENFPLLDILEGDPKCLARPSMVPACLIEIALQVAIQIILKATSFVLSFHRYFNLSNCRVYIHMIWRHHPSRASKAGDDQGEVLPFIPKEPYDVIACDCKSYHFYRFAREFLILVLKTQRGTNLTWWNLDMWSKQNHWHHIRLDSRLSAMMLMFRMWKA
ncbi:hypothetical protein L3X38_023815 [Prunus dulcis]|uniref:Uncharacterized protein n=1 Tax=Prunus dulcis TaxID=3755 RepID=A0AAD4Z6E6_PRUDU|nr:hypothetical protein L3X38_023815 [Prunus dulcis]